MSWCAVFGVRLRELWDGVLTFEGNFDVGVLNQIGEFSDVWRVICEGRPFSANVSISIWGWLGIFFFVLFAVSI